MLYLSKDEVKERADSRYTLVILAAKRARHLIEGLPPLDAEAADTDKPVTVAISEISKNLITYTR